MRVKVIVDSGKFGDAEVALETHVALAEGHEVVHRLLDQTVERVKRVYPLEEETRRGTAGQLGGLPE